MINRITPSGWAIAILGDLVSCVRGVSYKKSDARYVAESGLVPIIRATNIQQEVNFTDLVYVPGHYVKQEQYLQSGDVVVAASSGSRSIVGKAAYFNGDWVGSFGAFCLVLRPKSSMDDRYIGWFTQSEEYRNRVSTLAAGVNINNLRREHIEEAPVPLPPLAEQQRIVAEIETQFTRLDASVAALRRARANLKRYRASVLKAACEGRLVPIEADLARSEDRDYEPAGVLLERILSERRARWESQEKRRGKYYEPSAPDTSALPQLPEGWVWATVEQLILGTPQNGLYKPKTDYGDGIPILRIDDFQDYYLKDRESLLCLKATPEEVATYGLRQGQLVINRVNSPSHLGKCLVVPGNLLPAVFESNMMRMTTGNLVETLLVAYYLRSPIGRGLLISNAKWAVNQASINQTDVCNVPVPLPPLAEQRRIVAEVERRLSVDPAGGGHRGGQPGPGGAAAAEHPQAGVLRQARPPGPRRRAGVRAAGANQGRARGGSPGVRRRQEQVRAAAPHRGRGGAAADRSSSRRWPPWRPAWPGKERLRQSILKHAFSAKLVPQDPGDEPASALLERIRAEREAEAQASASVKSKSGRRGKRKVTR